MSLPTVAPRPASSVLVIRDSGSEIQVLMVQRPATGFFGGLMVFPGGAVEACDIERAVAPDMEYRIAAVRETAEEVGILVTTDGFVTPPPLRGAELLDAIDSSTLRSALAGLTLVSRWVTPSFAPKRFDTRFYITKLRGDPEVVLDADELVAHFWTSPQDALDRHAGGEWEMILPTVSHLRWLARWADVALAEAAASGTDGLTVIEPTTLDNGTLSARYRGEF